jgi:hypothetical protein
VVNRSELEEVQLHDTQKTVERFVELAARGLPQMFDPRAEMFCHKLKKTPGGLVQEGLSPRYTVMTVLGLHRLEQSGAPSPVTLKPVLEQLLAKTDWVENIGDLGLILWLAAHLAPERLGELERRLQIPSALSRFVDACEGVTMHLAWFLTGLSYASQVSGDSEKVRGLARETYHLLVQNQGKGGYFGHMASHRSLKGRVRGHIGSFADQVYPIYGMTQFFLAFGDEAALQRARECALAICQAQGPLGQWWWHYDSRGGCVFEEYPVFSVHQHGMGPMTLFALSRASGESFDPWIYKGLDWIDRRNELSVNMEDASASVIWRCISQSTLRRFQSALSGARGKGQQAAPEGLSVVFECRPYELGWLLYGLADVRHPSKAGAK